MEAATLSDDSPHVIGCDDRGDWSAGLVRHDVAVRVLPRTPVLSTTAYWYQSGPTAAFPALPPVELRRPR